MKISKVIIISSFVLTSGLAKADVGIFLGLSYAFGGGGPGVSLKVLSSDEENKAVVGAGVSYYPMSAKHLGADISVGYNFKNFGVTAGYDFLQSGVQIGAGYVNTDDDDQSRSPAPVVVPPPPPPPPPLNP